MENASGIDEVNLAAFSIVEAGDFPGRSSAFAHCAFISVYSNLNHSYYRNVSCPEMRVRYYIDPRTELPHIYNQDVSETDVEEILSSPREDRPGRDGSRVALGRTSGGRYLRVIYVPDQDTDSVFVITAYNLIGKPLTAFLRRRRRRHK